MGPGFLFSHFFRRTSACLVHFHRQPPSSTSHLLQTFSNTSALCTILPWRHYPACPNSISCPDLLRVELVVDPPLTSLTSVGLALAPTPPHKTSTKGRSTKGRLSHLQTIPLTSPLFATTHHNFTTNQGTPLFSRADHQYSTPPHDAAQPPTSHPGQYSSHTACHAHRLWASATAFERAHEPTPFRDFYIKPCLLSSSSNSPASAQLTTTSSLLTQANTY